MNFYQKRDRRTTIPILSLIDILAILLIFFIATMTFKPKEEKKVLLEIVVPKSSELPGVETPSLSESVVIAVNAEGQILLDGEFIELEKLPSAIEKLKSERPNLKLELKADQKIQFGSLVGVWDALAKAGFPMKDIATRLERPEQE